MIHSFLEADSLKVDIGQIHQTLKNNYRVLDKSFILDLKDKIEGYVFMKSCEPELGFHKTNCKYIRAKLAEAHKHALENTSDKLNFYFKGVKITKKMFSKMEYQVWLNEQNRFIKIDEQPDLSKRKINIWWHYAYDIYTYDQSIILETNFDDEEYNYFFSWFFVLLNPLRLKSVFDKKVLKSLGLSLPQLSEHLYLLAFKYPYIFELIDWKEKVMFLTQGKTLKLDESISSKLEETIVEEDPKKMSVKRPLNRSNGDNKTILTLEETMELFLFLQKNKIILDHNDNSRSNVAKCVSGLTGFSWEGLSKHRSESKLSKKTRAKLIGLIEKLKV